MTLEETIFSLILAIISAIVVVPIVFLVNDRLQFDQYLRLLISEIENNLDLIDNLPKNLEEIRTRKRQWLRGIASNQPREGYVLRYLSMNIYDNFRNQKYWIFLEEGSAGRLSELYECFDVYCKIIHKLQTCDDENNINITRDSDDYVISNIDRIYSEERFFKDHSPLFPKCPHDSYYTNLKKTTDLIKKYSKELLKSNSIETFKNPQWWCPNWMKYLLSDKLKEKIGSCLIGMLIGGFIIFTLFYFQILPTQINDNTYTSCFQVLDKTVIFNVGTAEINSISNASFSSGNETQQLNKIADLITNNYSAGIWDNNQTFQAFPNSLRYEYDKKGQIYIPAVDDSNRNLALDPNWLIYQKVGACRELSILFDSVAKKSGFSSRVVRVGNGDSRGIGATHWWNEVTINGVNKTFDVLWYGQIKYGVSKGSMWSGNRIDFENNSDGWNPQQLCSLGGVWITDDQGHKIEDITQDYMGSYNCTNYIHS
ncbi:hypothetical protein [Methanoregula sp.]|uniref:transglutaminase domain-containing protein n=1 Tax=Methanoregula sp. TaxID=2052170 RepID=UPI003BAE5C7C